ncbi:MAG: hypothetical protein JOY54_11325 [Acidobacteriaceae bacterium]|nr:hypothetical protein [Acidobacteriaceae bacterium]
MGDSLSAGVQNFSLLDTQQPHGYASVLATQLGTSLTLPSVPFPGTPNVLELESLTPFPMVAPAPGTLPFLRDNPDQQATNISVPGITVDQSLHLVPSLAPSAGPVASWAYIVLSLPGLPDHPAATQLEEAQVLKPTTVLEWVGNNDALVPALVGDLSMLTPVVQFANDYEAILDALSRTGARIITATIPDITEVAFFTSMQQLSKKAGVPVSVLTKELGTQSGDYLRLSAIPIVDQILNGQTAGPLPASCPTPLQELTPNPIPCVLKAADAAKLRSTIACYNSLIRLESELHGAITVDANALVNQIYSEGYKVNNQLLTTSYLGGLFSLDGVHPTNTGYAIIANKFIDVINQRFGTKYQHADVAAIFAEDPLAKYVPTTKGPLPPVPAEPGPIQGCSSVVPPSVLSASRQ